MQKINLPNRVVLAVSYLTALLFVYAATSKLLDFENFQVQLGQSPLLSAFAEYVSYAVPIVEIVLSVLLITDRYRIFGLYLSYSLMVMFTSYIYIILNFSSFIPCSCGGLLEELSWTQHIIFNLVFVKLLLVSIVLKQKGIKIINRILLLISVGILSFIVVYGLFLKSEKIMQYKNTFIRRFPHFPAVFEKEIQLSSDDYYFAGGTKDTIYLGDYTAPLKILEISRKGEIKKSFVRINYKDIPFSSIQIKINPPYFFLVDGNVPAVFQGVTTDWQAKYKMKGKSFFSTFEPLGSSSLIIRATLKSTLTNALGKISLNDSINIKFTSNLLQKQMDGVFDTDGQLHFDHYHKHVVYVYTYRNEYIVADEDLNLLQRGNTIDTISRAQLNVVKVQSNGETKLAAPPLIVNKTSALYRNLLFVNSQLPGQFERLTMWKKASIIDVYDVHSKKYYLSFYIYDIDYKKVRNMYVKDDALYALIDDQLVIYRLSKTITDYYN